jgi:hypothetical protein
MSSSTQSISRFSAARLESFSVSGVDSRSGVRTANTLSFPRARTQRAAVTALSTPPDKPTTAPRRPSDRVIERIPEAMSSSTNGPVDVERWDRTRHQGWCSWKLPSRFRTYLVMFAIDSKFSGRRSPSGTLSAKRLSMNSTSSRTPVESMTPASRREVSSASRVASPPSGKLSRKNRRISPSIFSEESTSAADGGEGTSLEVYAEPRSRFAELAGVPRRN